MVHVEVIFIHQVLRASTVDDQIIESAEESSEGDVELFVCETFIWIPSLVG